MFNPTNILINGHPVFNFFIVKTLIFIIRRKKSNKIPTTSEINLKIEQDQPVLNPTKKAEAQIHFGLGMRFENGEGVPQDYTEAIRWYRLAADQGHGKAQEKLNMLLNKFKEHFD